MRLLIFAGGVLTGASGMLALIFWVMSDREGYPWPG